MLLSISILIPIAAVYLMLSRAECPNVLLKLSLSVGLAAGLTSCTFFIIGLNILGSPNIAYRISEMAIFTGIAIIFAIMIRKKPVSMPENNDILTERKMYVVLLIALGISLICSVIAFVAKHLYLPHGAWDAWTIWNMRARFLFRLGEQWKEIYAHYSHYPHTDYPLLLSGTVARAWTYLGLGQETVLVPAAIALLFSLTTISLIYSSISHFKGRLHGVMAALTLIAAPYFVVQSVWQYADVPLGCMVLSALVFFALEDSKPSDNHRFVIFAGMSTGFCAWLKNEGLLIMLCMILARAVIVISDKGFKAYISETSRFMMGFLPILLMIVFYKIRFAPPNDLVSGQGAATLNRLTDISRYITTLKYYVVLAVKMLKLEILLFPAAIFLLGFSREKRYNLSIRTAWIAIVLILSGYFMVYITTPKNLVLHIETSYKRLLLHVFPGIVFAFFMTLASPEETRSHFEKESLS
jgi:hypothetical protein